MQEQHLVWSTSTPNGSENYCPSRSEKVQRTLTHYCPLLSQDYLGESCAPLFWCFCSEILLFKANSPTIYVRYAQQGCAFKKKTPNVYPLLMDPGPGENARALWREAELYHCFALPWDVHIDHKRGASQPYHYVFLWLHRKEHGEDARLRAGRAIRGMSEKMDSPYQSTMAINLPSFVTPIFFYADRSMISAKLCRLVWLWAS